MSSHLFLTRIPALAILLVAAASHACAAPNPLLEFLEKYRCPVADRLQRLYDAGDPSKDRDRFIAVTLLEHKHGYVQCLFHDDETMMLCEASSGFWYDKPGTPRSVRLAPDKIAALARLGFSTDGLQDLRNNSASLESIYVTDFNGISRIDQSIGKTFLADREPLYSAYQKISDRIVIRKSTASADGALSSDFDLQG